MRCKLSLILEAKAMDFPMIYLVIVPMWSIFSSCVKPRAKTCVINKGDEAFCGDDTDSLPLANVVEKK